jgi:ketose-bisphosphate aldolase
MKFLPMSELLSDAASRGYAVPSFCVWNAEAMDCALRVAAECRAPVILMNGPGEFPLLPPAAMAATAIAVSARYSVRAALHLDHGESIEQVEACLSAGYTSVMLDFSARSYAENAAALRQVAQRAHPLGVTVEGEIGRVGKADDMTTEGGPDSTLTVPAEAARYVAETGVDALAVSIGNAHGQYTRLPRLDFDRLTEIHKLARVPLVLHGGSGTPEADIKKAISRGVAKINVATELIASVRESLKGQWRDGRNPWLPLAQAEAMQAMEAVLRKWIVLTGAAQRS